MNKMEFQDLAGVRLREAHALLADGLNAGAYYLAGYAIECALKACIANLTREHDFPPDRTALQDIYTHDLTRLVRAAKLENELRIALVADRAFRLKWEAALGWSEASRYLPANATAASDLVAAVGDPAHGVLQWVMLHW